MPTSEATRATPTSNASHLTTNDLAERWNKSPVWVRRAAKARAIPGMKIGRDWRFSLDLIEDYENRLNKYADPLAAPPRRGGPGRAKP